MEMLHSNAAQRCRGCRVPLDEAQEGNRNCLSLPHHENAKRGTYYDAKASIPPLGEGKGW
jgi:hypothetical protein